MRRLSLFFSIFVLAVFFFAFGAYSNAVYADTLQCNHAKEKYEFTRIKKPSTCIYQGLGVYTCPSCGKEETRRMPFAAHIPGEWKVKTDSTCSRIGTEECYCQVCNEVFETRDLDKKAHSFGEWGITTKPTCCEEGVQKRICKYCGFWESKAVLPTGVHVFGEFSLTSLPNCSAHGYKTRTCLTCDESIYLTLAMNEQEHSFTEGEILIKNSGLFEGKIRYVCTDCGEVREQTIPAAGHRLTSVEKNKAVCACGYSETKTKSFGVSKQVFACEKGTLTLKTSEPVNGEYIFDFCEMTEALSAEYKKFYPAFSKGYLFRLECGGKPCDTTEEMTLSIALDEEWEDHHVKIAVLRSGKFYYLENFKIKNGEIRIGGAELAGAEAVFLEKGERITMSIAVPITVTVVTVIAAAGAVLWILSRRKPNENAETTQNENI
ncbi:MAG: hypothetical protein E7603_03610 [Ruminococcaceae bacterium]|nr:hypothetical protein [Oscillospiraceae bacterium]